MLNVFGLTVTFAGEDLFSEISFKLNAGDRVGLIGKNGAGKSTLLRILSKEISHNSGELSYDKGTTIGFLKQDIDFVKGRTVAEEVYQGFVEIQKLKKQLDDIHDELTKRDDYESESYNQLLIDLSDITHQFEIVGGYEYEGKAEKVLLGLGFERTDFDKLTDTFSGGWRMRIELAKLLLQDHDILLLDEPTNHLDINSIIWLEQFLINYTGCVVIVSHDKMFLDNVTNRSIEISMGRIYDFNKPYSKYLKIREELIANQLAQQKNQEKEIERTEKLIERFKAKASKASMAQSLMKRLDKVERIEVDEMDQSVMNVSFPMGIQPGKVILECEFLSKSYGENKVLDDISLIIERGDKIAFVGQNGQGKSTLAKVIVSEIKDHVGTLKTGHNVDIGYFAQNQSEYLDADKTLLDTMQESANDSNRGRVRDILGSFLFKGDDVYKKTGVLSGGERNRLALAKMLLQPFNTLVMDEPTNHLDIQSKNILKTALQQFEGTLILVSHDRDFLQDIANRVFEFKDHKVKEFPGDINYYLEQRNLKNLRDLEKKEKQQNSKKSTDNEAMPDSKEDRKLKNRINTLEQKITTLESELKKIETQITQEVSDELLRKYSEGEQKLATLMEQWEALQG